ncbi:MAG: gliding motility-associated C-terminal domain-containing protein [Bacteroidia bacterium]
MKQRLPAFIIFLFITCSLFAENRYWVGGSGNWNDVAHWSVTINGIGGAAIPTANDDVFLGLDGNGAAKDTLHIDGNATCGRFAVGNELIPNYDAHPHGSYNMLVLKGNGKIQLNGSLVIRERFEDYFTGTWKLQDRISGYRDNSIAIVSGSTHVFAGKFIFESSENPGWENTYSIEGEFYVNNEVRVEKNVRLFFTRHADVALLTLTTDPQATLVQQEVNRFVTGSNQRIGNPPPTPQSHTVTTVVVPNLCNGDCQATATAVVVGGSGSFTYTWSNTQTSQTATGLCAGTYLVVVTDLINGDQVPAFAIVTDPPPLIIFFSNVSPLCNGMCNGSSSASVAGGTAPYNYLWAPGGQTTSIITNQCAGVYTLTVTDANGCIVTQQSVITQPSPLVPNGIRTNVTCFGACNGTATVAPAGGTAPYSFSWAPGGQTTPSISGLCPGSYTCTVTDNNGCQNTYVAVITQPALLQVTIAHTNASCNGSCNGTATSTVTGGTAPYVYLWLPGLQITPNISGQCAGTYTLNITDANGCTASNQVTITQPPALIVAPTGVNIACFGTCTGTAAANVSGGTPGYTYSWAPSGGTGPTASSLCPATYTVSVTDLNGCQGSGQVTITQPPQLFSNSSGTNVTCFGTCNGSATANGSGGVGPYSYNWLPGNINSQTINALCPGSYTVTVTDINGCNATGTVTITQPNVLQPNTTSTNVTCNNLCNGTATSNPVGGVGPYTYLWMPGSQTTNSISGLCAGSYTLTVTDANSCVQNQTVIITQPNPLTVTINATQISCNAVCNGAAAAAVSGGTPPYSYLWLPGNQTTPSISNLCAGSYTIQITDANSCVNSASVVLIQPTALVLAPSVTNTSCNGSCNGTASVSASGGMGPYTYSWAPGGQTTSSINSLCAGSYTVTVTDASGCTSTQIITVTQPPALTAGINSNNVSCNGGCNGSASATPAGGTGPYTFLWMPGSFTTSSVNGLCPGTYTVTITDANLCTLNQQVSITQPAPLSALVLATTSSCGNCNGTATVAVSGGTAPYAYFWTPTNQTNPTATNLCIGNYTVNLTDAAGCTTTATCSVLPIVNIVVTSSTTSLSCFGSCDGIASANAAGGANPYTYLWMPGNYNTQTVTGLCAGSYTVTATDANACFNTSTVTFVNPPLLTAAASSVNVSCNGVCDGNATVTPSGGTGAYSYVWSPGGQTTSSISNLCVGNYTCTISDANNCTATATFMITEPTLITSSETVIPANCTLCDGSITANPAGGVGSYTFLWAPSGQTTQSISNLCPGIYTVTITDASGCSVVTPIAVSNVNGPTVISSSTNVSCNAVCDGTGNANVTGGTPVFVYDWTPGNPAGDGTPSVTGLCAGTYFCQVTDGVGCITFASIIITQPQSLAATAAITNVSCNGNMNGSITVNPSGGTGPYSYSWLPGLQTTQTISGQVAGTYTVTTTDANFCSITQQFTITQPAVLSAAMAFTNILCNNACNGTATVTLTGGTAPYTYSWSSGQGTAGVANLCPGTYTVNITDANGCTTQQTVAITQPAPLISSITSTNASCNGVCNGTATVTASGGIPGYSYTWSPGGGTTPFASGLCAGAYSVITLDTNGCSSVSSVIILQPAAIVLSASSGPVTCFGNCNGVAIVNASGGSPGYSYNWAPGGQTTPTATMLCSGIYTVTVTDLNGCSQNVSTAVAQPSLLQANTSFTSPQCNGGCNGTATANPVGGTGPYSYLWAPNGEVTATITNVCAGTYTVTVYDANGCSDIRTVSVTPVSGMSVLSATAPASCGNCDGTINVTPSGGVGPYSFVWSGGLPSGPNQVNVCAGVYTLTLTDATGCVGTFTVIINNSGGPTGETVVSVDVTCPASCNGSATVTPIGGIGPYTYLWIPGGQTVNSLTGMCAGNYFLRVTDANGCIRFSPVVINTPLPITGNPFVTNATCTGICDGAIALTPSGGTGPYTYSWAPNGQTTATINSLCIGSYTATITDANGCTQASASTVNPWNVLAATITSANPGCSNACNGSATVNITSGSAPFNYNWTDPLAQTTSTATGLCAGAYNVTITDGGGCSAILPVTLNTPNPIVIAPVITPTTCGQCNGAVTLNPGGGTSPYTFLWSNGAMTSTVNGMCAGVYTVNVSDAAGCTMSFTINISSSAGPTAVNAALVNASCNGTCDGAISLAPTGGILPYTYLWLPGGQTTSSVTNMCAGSYTVQVRDSAGCTLTQSFVLTSPSAIVPNQFITNTSCGVCAGSIALTPSGGTGPYAYSWAPGGQTTATINGLCAGLYTVTITDATGCTKTQAIPVSNFNSGMAISASTSNVNCNASCTGSATITVVGGNTPYTYSWSNAATTDTLNGLCAGNYIVQVTDASGCVTTAGIVISEPTPLAGSFPFVQDELCANACNGSITAIPSGGTLPYSYSWNPTAQSTQTATNLCGGVYTVTVTDANGCVLTQTDSVDSPVVLVLSAPVVTDATCSNSPDGAIDVTVNGGAIPYTYSWTGPGSFTASTQDITNVFSGSYTITITDANGCSVTDTILVNALTTLFADAGNDTASCVGGTLILDGSGSSNATAYQWIQLPSGAVISNSVTANINPAPGTTSFVLIVTNGVCTATDTVIVTSSPGPAANAGPDQEIVTGMTVTIGGNPTGPVGSVYAWGPSTGLGDPTIANPVASPAATTSYVVVVTDANGCTGSDTMVVVVVPVIDFPNGFTPNGDGINDVWEIDNIYLFPDCQVQVYNRWGELLFNSIGYNPPWDGRFEGKDVPVGTYYYIIKLNDPLFPEVYTGPLTIMR